VSPALAPLASVVAWLRWIFVEPGRGRPRVVVRLVLHAVAVLLGYVAGGTLVWLAGGAGWARAIAIVLQTVVVLTASWAAARRLDRRSPLELTGRLDRSALLELAVGTLLGLALIGAVGGIEIAAGLARYRLVEGTPSITRVSSAILFFVAIAIDEEIWFRGYQLTNVADALTARLGERRARLVALAVSSVIFGLAHALNPNATLLSTMNVAIGGLLLGVSFAITGRLGVAVGLHFAWNTAQCMLDMPVSGQSIADELLLHREELGADVITGGAFGPEGGLVGLGAIAVGTVASVIFARLGGQGRPEPGGAPAGRPPSE